MTCKEEIKGNKLIGLFLGAKYVNDNLEEYPNGYYTCNLEDNFIINGLIPEDWMFSYSMDWLYPVYQKIIKFMETTYYSLDIDMRVDLIDATSNIKEMFYHGENTPNIFKKIVQWIEKYNKKILKDGQ